LSLGLRPVLEEGWQPGNGHTEYSDLVALHCGKDEGTQDFHPPHRVLVEGVGVIPPQWRSAGLGEAGDAKSPQVNVAADIPSVHLTYAVSRKQYTMAEVQTHYLGEVAVGCTTPRGQQGVKVFHHLGGGCASPTHALSPTPTPAPPAVCSCRVTRHTWHTPQSHKAIAARREEQKGTLATLTGKVGGDAHAPDWPLVAPENCGAGLQGGSSCCCRCRG
jgi:hypothetical protein